MGRRRGVIGFDDGLVGLVSFDDGFGDDYVM